MKMDRMIRGERKKTEARKATRRDDNEIREQENKEKRKMEY